MICEAIAKLSYNVLFCQAKYAIHKGYIKVARVYIVRAYILGKLTRYCSLCLSKIHPYITEDPYDRTSYISNLLMYAKIAVQMIGGQAKFSFSC